MITADNIKYLLSLQEATNVAYFGNEWKKHWTETAVNNSIYREWAEFLDEVTLDWKIYGDGIHWKQVDAIYELVDVIHFMLSAVIVDSTTEDIQEQLELIKEFDIPEKPSFAVVTRFFTQFMNMPTCLNLGMFLSWACGYLGLEAEIYMKAHNRKNDRNRLRAAGGASYDKSQETPLTLEF